MYLLTTCTIFGPYGARIGDVLSAAAAIFFPVGLVLTSEPVRGLGRLRRMLDVATVSGAVFVMAWQFVLAPGMAALGVTASVVMPIVVMVPLALGVSVALVTAASAPTRSATALHLLALAALIQAITAMLALYNNMTNVVWYAHGVGGGYVFGALIVAIASRHDMPRSTANDARQLVRSVWALLPYLPVVLAVAAVATAQMRLRRLAPILVWLMLCIFCLVLLRQLTTLLTLGSMAIALQEQKAVMEYQAHHDMLTGLPNRAAFYDRRVWAMRDAHRVVVMLLDLDGFKQVNDSLGHAAGDQVLKVVAGRLIAALRPTDVTCRLGGDEFSVLMTDVLDHTVLSVVQRLLDTIGEPIFINGTSVAVGASIGITSSWTWETTTVDELLRRADAAMYAAKGNGKGRMHIDFPIRQPGDTCPLLFLSGSEAYAFESFRTYKKSFSSCAE